MPRENGQSEVGRGCDSNRQGNVAVVGCDRRLGLGDLEVRVVHERGDGPCATGQLQWLLEEVRRLHHQCTTRYALARAPLISAHA